MPRHRRLTHHERDEIARHEGPSASAGTGVGGRVRGCRLELDVGHRGLGVDDAVHEVERAVRRVRTSAVLRVLKVVHGSGRGPGGSAIRRAVRTRLQGMASLRAVIPGERYELLDVATQALRAAVGQDADPDLGRANDGVTIVWVR